MECQQSDKVRDISLYNHLPTLRIKQLDSYPHIKIALRVLKSPIKDLQQNLKLKKKERNENHIEKIGSEMCFTQMSRDDKEQRKD